MPDRAWTDGDGLLDGPQHNTLDQPWFGKVAWLSSLYLAAARACEEMAGRWATTHSPTGAARSSQRGGRKHRPELFNGEYYFQISDAEHPKSVGSHDGCEIDQVFGQSWAYQVGLGRILPETHVKKALRRCGGTTSRPTSAPTARPTSPAAGTPWRARPAC